MTEYILALGPLASYVAAELEGAAGAALSVSDLAAGYGAFINGDLMRVQNVEGLDGEQAAKEWMVRRTLPRFTPKKAIAIDEPTGTVTLVNGYTFDNIKWDGKQLRRIKRDEPVRLGAPFDKLTGGQFVENVERLGNLDELRESMAELGWVDDISLWAIADEHGVVLVGHRRLKVAAELRAAGVLVHGKEIPDRIRTVTCGRGDQADVKRFNLALVTNIGHRRTKVDERDRKRIVAVLAGPGHDWSQMSLAKALGVSQQQISLDVKALKESGELPVTSNSPPPKRPDRSKTGRRGRPPKPTPEPVELLDAIPPKPSSVIDRPRPASDPEPIQEPPWEPPVWEPGMDSLDMAAAAVGVSRAEVEQAKAIRDAAPDLAEKVKAGDMTLDEATQECEARLIEPACNHTCPHCCP